MLSKIKVALRTRTVISAALCLAATVAYADVVVVAAAKSTIGVLTREQVDAIFLAKKSFKLKIGGEMVTPVDQPEGSAVRDEFYIKVAYKNAAQLKAYWSDALFSGLSMQRPKTYPDSEMVKKVVAGNPAQIGYISKDVVDSSVKVILAP